MLLHKHIAPAAYKNEPFYRIQEIIEEWISDIEREKEERKKQEAAMEKQQKAQTPKQKALKPPKTKRR